MYYLVIFIIFTWFCNHYHWCQRIFIIPEGTPNTRKPVSPPSKPCQPLICFPTPWCSVLCVSYPGNHKSVSFPAGFFHLAWCLQGSSSCSLSQELTPHCHRKGVEGAMAWSPHVVFLSSSVGPLDCFYSKSGIAGQMVTLGLNCQGAARLFFTMTTPVYNPTSNVCGLGFFHIFVNTCYCLFWL